MISAHSKAALQVACLLASVCLLVASDSAVPCRRCESRPREGIVCQACHGLDGLSKTPDAPNIAGQTEPYLLTQLQAFKSGTRKNDAMSVVVPSLSDKDIEDLAAYFSAIEITIAKVPGG